MKLKIVGALAVAAALIVGLAIPAAAETKTFPDKIGDAVRTSAAKPVGKASAPDISKVKIAYNKSNLVVTTSFTNLTKKNWTNLNLFIDTTGDKKYNVTLNVWNATGTVTHRIADSWSITMAENAAAPVTVKAKFAKKNRVAITIPVRYLGVANNPPKKVGVIVAAHRLDPANDRSLGSDWAPSGNSDFARKKWMTITNGAGKASTKTITTTTLTLARTTQTYRMPGARATAIVNPKVPGKVSFYDGKTKVRTISVTKGRVDYTLPSHLSPGKHTITVRFQPDNAKKYKASKSKPVTVEVKKMERRHRGGRR